MKEISLNILDIAENSVKAGATLTEISVLEKGETLTLVIKDNGSGMTDEVLKTVSNPFYTTRTTRKVGMGIPLLKLAAEMTGGSVTIESKHYSDYPTDHGTVVTAIFYKNHIDCTPLGDVVSSITTLIQGHPDIDFLFIARSVRLFQHFVRYRAYNAQAPPFLWEERRGWWASQDPFRSWDTRRGRCPEESPPSPRCGGSAGCFPRCERCGRKYSLSRSLSSLPPERRS